MAVQRRGLTVVDRTIIELRRRDGWSIRLIARELGRSSGTICDEIGRHGDAAGYLAATAEADAAASRCRSGRKPRLMPDGPLFAEIAGLLRLGWSPEQISGRRKRIENGMEQPSGLRVSHEAIYTALYALPRGELRRELLSYLRQAKPVRGRKPKGSERRGKLCNMTNIKERPEEIEGRLVPGHWEGDLILGAGGASAVGTLVERTTRLVVLVHMPTRKAEVAASAFAGALNAIPAPLRKTLTYDQGKEMAGRADRHAHLLRRPALTLAAGRQREHQRPAAPVPAERQLPGQAGPERPRPGRRQPQRSAQEDTRLRHAE